MKYIFIINPKAGKGSAVKTVTQKITQCFAGREDYEIHQTAYPGQGTEIARALAQSGEELCIFACGGDGSTFDVLNGIAGHPNVLLGVLPCGTGNDFLRYFDHPEHFSSVEDQLAGEEILVDVIRADGRYCLNQASMGLDALVCAHKDKFSRLPLVKGQFAYILSLLYCFFYGIKNHFTVQVDDRPPIEKDYAIAVAANGRYYGGGFKSAPDAMINDGLMDCMTVDTVSRPRILSLLGKYTKGEHLSLPICRMVQGRKMTVVSHKETVVNLDGEVFPATRVTFELLPAALRFLVPKGAVAPLAETKEKEPALQA